MCQSRVALLYFGSSPRLRSLCRLLLAPAAIRIFSTLFCESFLGCLVPCPGGPIGCMRLLTSPMSSAFPLGGWVGFPLLVHDATFRGNDFRGCRHSIMFKPPSLFASQVAPTATAMPLGGRGFYVRAERASLPPHAPDMLAVRTQAIDGARTCTLLDSQHCRLLPSQIVPTDLSSQGSRGFYVRAEHASLPPHASDMLTTRPGNWWCGDLHPTRFAALSAAPVQTRFYDNVPTGRTCGRTSRHVLQPSSDHRQ
jgi:hypothetical protein